MVNVTIHPKDEAAMGEWEFMYVCDRDEKESPLNSQSVQRAETKLLNELLYVALVQHYHVPVAQIDGTMALAFLLYMERGVSGAPHETLDAWIDHCYRTIRC